MHTGTTGLARGRFSFARDLSSCANTRPQAITRTIFSMTLGRIDARQAYTQASPCFLVEVVRQQRERARPFRTHAQHEHDQRAEHDRMAQLANLLALGGIAQTPMASVVPHDTNERLMQESPRRMQRVSQR